MQSSGITGDGLYALAYLQKIDLQILDLSNNDLGNEGAQYLRNVLPTLVELSLSNTKIGHKGCLELAKSIGPESAPFLQSIDISRNNIESDAFAKMLQKLKPSKTLQRLNVSENDFSLFQDEFESLGNFLKHNSSIKLLNLSQCGLQLEAIQFVARGLKYNSSLECLMLGDNNLMDPLSMKYLVEALCKP